MCRAPARLPSPPLPARSNAGNLCDLSPAHPLRPNSFAPTLLAKGVVSHWPAYSSWTDDYLCQLAGDTEVTVALTPNGRADAVTPLPPPDGAVAASPAGPDGDAASSATTGDGAAPAPGGCSAGAGHCFALPHQVKMPLRDFLALLHSSKQAQAGSGGQGGTAGSAADLAGDAAAAIANGGGGGRRVGTGHCVVPYLQFQNSSLTKEVRRGAAVGLPGRRCSGAALGLQLAPPPRSAAPLARCLPVCRPPCKSHCTSNLPPACQVPELLGDVDLLLSWATQAFGGWAGVAPGSLAPPGLLSIVLPRGALRRRCLLARQSAAIPTQLSYPTTPTPLPAGGLPEAVNLWVGDERSVTSWHKDPFGALSVCACVRSLAAAQVCSAACMLGGVPCCCAACASAPHFART